MEQVVLVDELDNELGVMEKILSQIDDSNGSNSKK